MKILFICFSGLKFDVTSPEKEPLGGTESAVAYLARELAVRGHTVTLMNNNAQPPGEVLCGVTHLQMTENVVGLDPDVVILPSAPSAVLGVQKALPRAKVIVWNHMRPDQPAMQAFFEGPTREAMKHVVFVSDIQRRAYGLLTPIEGTTVLNNGIAPCFENMFADAEELRMKKECRGAYTSTPFRGLAVLASVKEIPIEVYSSMKVYQADDTPYASMYENLKANDCLELKGSVSQQELASNLKRLAFFVYPSFYPECHSIAIIEAMAAGMAIITTDCAIEPNEFVEIMPVGGSVEEFAKLLRKSINFFRSRPEEWADKMWKQVQYINSTFTWKQKALEWETYLSEVLDCKNIA